MNKKLKQDVDCLLHENTKLNLQVHRLRQIETERDSLRSKMEIIES